MYLFRSSISPIIKIQPRYFRPALGTCRAHHEGALYALEDLRYAEQSHAFHEAVPGAVAEVQMARMAGHVLPQGDMPEGVARGDVREPDVLLPRPEDAHRRRVHGGGDVHRAAVVGDVGVQA